MSPTRGDEGTIIPLVTGLALLAMLLVFGGIAASAAFLATRDLASACDGAVLAAADAVAESPLYAGGARPVGRLPLSRSDAERAVRAYLAVDSAGQTRPTVAAVTVGADGRTVTARCRRTGVRLPFGAVFGLGAGIDRTVTSRAETPLR